MRFRISAPICRPAAGLALGVALMPAVASAHPGHAEGAALVAGLAHPLGGTDHMLAMVAVGLWAAVTGGRAVWAMPLAFLVAMLGGGLAGAAGLAVAAVEPMIFASTILFGAAAALALRPALPLALAAVAVFGAAHGLAHGTEGPQAGLAPYAAGFIAATAALHLTGLLAGRGLARLAGAGAARSLGAGAALAGLALAFA
ncbi:HupE/UreJ family protein [Cereibacter sphaeroides]|uniref:HupE/UreJ family protein n=1 Tax=Cereibacter sphaeroides TaxID=1063 RepID=UPI001F21CCFF|nr:HupE/UreJ family protein [Cereibacter sphaeroides]MCE6960462.1 HupE/UreJ family protein [Cereibacter sphaeroides]MCE6969412.1 HupE/UreJ family protein [Cereibacter sphaeroides]MCE6975470.1 HupE/UreJ family protein [Cereibacter sphaeroides]